MGILWSRQKKSTIEVLEGLEKDISNLETYRRDTEVRQKYLIGYMIILSVCVYLLVVLLGYIFYYPTNLTEAVLRLFPLLVFPIMIYMLRIGVIWFFRLQIERNDRQLVEVRRKRKTILEEVKEKETYKVATEILERFDPDTKLRKAAQERKEKEERERKDMMERMKNTPPHLRQRLNVTPQPGAPLKMAPQGTPVVRTGPDPAGAAMMPGPAFGTPRLPRPILSSNRGPMDKIVDKLLGDGPNNRYALICKACSSHNGMALQEEFEYLAFRCCFCHHFNPARKQKPHAPTVVLNRSRDSSQSSSSRAAETGEQAPKSSESHELQQKNDSPPNDSKPKESAPVEPGSVQDLNPQASVEEETTPSPSAAVNSGQQQTNGVDNQWEMVDDQRAVVESDEKAISEEQNDSE